MLPDPGCYEERYRLAAGAAAGLAAGLITIGLVFLTVAPWVTGVVIAVALTGLAVAARRMIAFRADHAGITLGAVPGNRRAQASFEAVRACPALSHEQTFLVEDVGRRPGQYIGVATSAAARPVSSVRFQAMGSPTRLRRRCVTRCCRGAHG